MPAGPSPRPAQQADQRADQRAGVRGGGGGNCREAGGGFGAIDVTEARGGGPAVGGNIVPPLDPFARVRSIRSMSTWSDGA
jgi:hypothetical protein